MWEEIKLNKFDIFLRGEKGCGTPPRGGGGGVT